MNRRLLKTMKAAGLATLVLGCLPTAAQAIPLNQFDVVEGNPTVTTSESFFLVPNTSVTVNNGTTAPQLRDPIQY